MSEEQHHLISGLRPCIFKHLSQVLVNSEAVDSGSGALSSKEPPNDNIGNDIPEDPFKVRRVLHLLLAFLGKTACLHFLQHLNRYRLDLLQIPLDEVVIEDFREDLPLILPGLPLIHNHGAAHGQLEPILVEMRLLDDVVLLGREHVLDEARLQEDEGDHVGGVADDDVHSLVIVLLVVHGVAVLPGVVTLVLEQHDLVRVVGKDQDAVPQTLQGITIPLDQTFGTEVVLVVV